MATSVGLYTGFQRFMSEILNGFETDMRAKFTCDNWRVSTELTDRERVEYGEFLKIFYKFSEIRLAPIEYYIEILDLTKARPDKITLTVTYLKASLGSNLIGIVLQYVSADDVQSRTIKRDEMKRDEMEEIQAWNIRKDARLAFSTKFKLKCLYKNLKHQKNNSP